MKLSARTRYGARLMVKLACEYGKDLVFLRTIAKSEDISEKYLSQIIIPLKAAGLVNAVRGVQGGYMLAKNPKNITMKDIFYALEGKAEIMACFGGKSSCKRSSICVTQGVWHIMQKSINSALEGFDLEGLAKQYKSLEKDQTVYFPSVF
ncbi:MAG: Rrf2 family transcriptional regulator [Elusimicrobiota bacterium]